MAGAPDFSMNELHGKSVHFYLTENSIYPTINTGSLSGYSPQQGDVVIKYSFNSKTMHNNIEDIGIVYNNYSDTISFTNGLKQQIEKEIQNKWNTY